MEAVKNIRCGRNPTLPRRRHPCDADRGGRHERCYRAAGLAHPSAQAHSARMSSSSVSGNCLPADHPRSATGGTVCEAP